MRHCETFGRTFLDAHVIFTLNPPLDAFCNLLFAAATHAASCIAPPFFDLGRTVRQREKHFDGDAVSGTG